MKNSGMKQNYYFLMLSTFEQLSQCMHISLLLLFMSMVWDSTHGPIVHPPDDIWVWTATVEWYWQGKPKNSDRNLSQCLRLGTTLRNSLLWQNTKVRRAFHLHKCWSLASGEYRTLLSVL
jgi:hypothetical protein